MQPVTAFAQSASVPGSADQSDARSAVVDEAGLPPELRNFLDDVSAFQARFIQELWSDDQRLIEVAQGSVELMRPGRFRWNYESPWEQVIVADGDNLWMYDIDIAQVTRSDMVAADPGNPAALLSGDATVLDQFDVVSVTDANDEVWIELAPKTADSEYATVRVAFSRAHAGGMLSALEFVDGLDQTTLIRFQDAQLNPQLTPDRFRFEVPEGVHVLGGPG